MDRRLELHLKLKQLIGNDHVYFQPPQSVKLEYPCYVYKRSVGKTKYADNNPYLYKQAYQLTLIDEDPDSGLVQRTATGFETIKFDTHFTKDNLNHDVFTVYY